MLFFLSCLPADEDTIWSGNIYELQGSQLESSASSSIHILSPEGEQLYTAEAPYESSPYYREFSLESQDLSKEVLLLVEGENVYPTMYVGTTPSTNAIWLNGALYGYGKSWTESFFLSLGKEISSPSQGQYAQLIGRPNEPTDWANTELSILHSSGEEYAVERYRYDDSGFLLAIQDGEVFDRIDLFVSTDLPEGAITIDVHRADESMSIAYYAINGTVINATHLLFIQE